MRKKLIKNIFTILFIAIIILMLGNIKVNAESANLTATAPTANVGDSVNINLTYTAAAWNLKVSGDGITGKTFASQTSDLSEETKNETFALDTSKAGTYTISLTGDITNKDGKTTDINTSVTVTVNEKVVTTNPEPAPNPEPPAPVVLSKNANLRNLGINPHDFSGFKPGILNYNAEVPYDTEKVNIYAYTQDSKAKVIGTGNKNLSVGNNKFNIVVTAEDGTTTKTYTLVVKRQTEEETNANQNPQTPETTDVTLKSLEIEGITLTPSFDKNTYKYSAKLTKDIDKLEVKAIASDEKVTVKIEGNEELKTGENTIKVKLTSDSDETAEYTIIVNKDLTEEKKGLSELKVEGITLSPSFDPDVYNYVATMTEDLKKLKVTALNSDGKTDGIEITGNEEIEFGENTITILVNDEESGETLTYQILITKELQNEEETTKKGTNIGKIILIVAAIIIIIALIILLKPKKNKNAFDEDEEDDNFNDDTFNPFEEDSNNSKMPNTEDSQNQVENEKDYNLDRSNEYNVFEDKQFLKNDFKNNDYNIEEDIEESDYEIEERKNRLKGKRKGKHF